MNENRQQLIAKVFDSGEVKESCGAGTVGKGPNDPPYEIRIPIDTGIAGHVATTG